MIRCSFAVLGLVGCMALASCAGTPAYFDGDIDLKTGPGTGPGGFGGEIDLSTETGTGPDGVVRMVRILGDDAGDLSGHSVSSAGDVNGDGYDDFLIGAYLAHPAGGSAAGETYLVFGRGGVWSDIDFGATLSSSTAIRILGDDADDHSGYSVSSAGDVNGDGCDDFVIGAYWADQAGGDNAGETYLILGAPQVLVPTR